MSVIDQLRKDTLEGSGPVRRTTSSRLDSSKHNLLSESPVVKKSVVDAVLDGVIAAGNGAVSLLAGLLATVLIVYSGYVLVDTFGLQYRASHTSWDLLQFKPEIIDDYGTPLAANNMLSSINSDYRSWLTVYDTNIDYPVVQGTDDLYYATHDIYKQPSISGAIYLAAANSPDYSDSYNLIYGHHMDGDIMFGSLDQFKNPDYFTSHQKALLITETQAYDVTFFAVAETDAYESNIYTVGNRAEQVLAFLSRNVDGAPGGGTGVGVGTRVWFYGGDPESLNKILALSTCANASTNGRLVVFGTMTPRIAIDTGRGYDGIYDGKPHYADQIVARYGDTVLEDAVVEYFNEKTGQWQPMDDDASISNVGSKTLRVRVRHPLYGTAEGTVTLTVRKRTVILTSASASKYYDGTPLTRNAQTDVAISGYGFAEGEGVTFTITGSQTAVGSSPNTFTFTYLPGTNPDNYDIHVTEGVLTVYQRRVVPSWPDTPVVPVVPGAPAAPANQLPAAQPAGVRVVDIDEYDVPLGIDSVYINVGDTIE